MAIQRERQPGQAGSHCECRDGEGMSVLLRAGAGTGGSEEEAEKCPRVQPDNQTSPALAPNRASCDLLGFCIASPVLLCSLLPKALVTSGSSACPPRVDTYPKEKEQSSLLLRIWRSYICMTNTCSVSMLQGGNISWLPHLPSHPICILGAVLQLCVLPFLLATY